jgi:uncharacterized membrane protein
MTYELLKWLHILSSTLLFGTGIGSAYYLLFASRTGDARVVAAVSSLVVWADWLFTATTLLFQPISGWALAWMVGFPLNSRWLVWSTVLLVVAGLCWLPVVWLQMRMRDLARQAARENVLLPLPYWRYLTVWVLLGIPALISLLVVFYLMVAKPV